MSDLTDRLRGVAAGLENSKNYLSANAVLDAVKRIAELVAQKETAMHIAHGQVDEIESQARRIAELEGRLREEIISNYDDLTPTRKARYADAEAYADAVLKSEQQP